MYDVLWYALNMIYNEVLYRMCLLDNYTEKIDDHSKKYYNKILSEARDFNELKKEFNDLMDYCLRKEVDGWRRKTKN